MCTLSAAGDFRLCEESQSLKKRRTLKNSLKVIDGEYTQLLLKVNNLEQQYWVKESGN